MRRPKWRMLVKDKTHPIVGRKMTRFVLSFLPFASRTMKPEAKKQDPKTESVIPLAEWEIGLARMAPVG